MNGSRFIDHAGDTGIEAWGEDLETLFRHAGEAFTRILTDPDTVRTAATRRISLRADGLEQLLVHWLNELNVLFETEGLLFREFRFHTIEPNCLEAEALGEVYRGDRHPIYTPVKGATYHRLDVHQEGDLWKARVILDL